MRKKTTLNTHKDATVLYILKIKDLRCFKFETLFRIILCGGDR